MKSIKYILILIASAGLLFMGACNNSNQAADTSLNTQPSASPILKAEGQHGKSHGGQIVETGAYHLEFVPIKEANGTHLDLYLQRGDNHEAIPNAKVTAQIQLPDGTQKTVSFTYDVKGKHYAGLLKEEIGGPYQVKVNADIQGKKVDGRFNFNR
jgi:hypothetical protein